MLNLQDLSQRELIEIIEDLEATINVAHIDLGAGDYDSAIEGLQSSIDKLELYK